MSLRIAVLGMLASQGPASGYELAKHFDSSINYVWQAKHSQIYPELARAVETGAAVVEDVGGGRGRKVYTVTEAGREEVGAWLSGSESITRNVRSETALRAFLLPLLQSGDAVNVMRAEAARHEQRLADLEKLRDVVVDDAAGGAGAPFGIHALDLGIRSAEMYLRWARDTADQLTRDAG